MGLKLNRIRDIQNYKEKNDKKLESTITNITYDWNWI